MFALRHVSDQSSSPPLALDLSLVLTLAATKRKEKRRQRSRPSAIKAETHIFSFRNKPQGTSAVLVSRFVVILVSRGTIGCPTGDQRATHAQRFRFWTPFSLFLSLSLSLLAWQPFTCYSPGEDFFLDLESLTFWRLRAFSLGTLILIDRCTKS